MRGLGWNRFEHTALLNARAVEDRIHMARSFGFWAGVVPSTFHTHLFLVRNKLLKLVPGVQILLCVFRGAAAVAVNQMSDDAILVFHARRIGQWGLGEQAGGCSIGLDG